MPKRGQTGVPMGGRVERPPKGWRQPSSKEIAEERARTRLDQAEVDEARRYAEQRRQREASDPLRRRGRA